MSKLIAVHDKSRIQAFLQENIYLHIYSIGDLDDFFWPGTIWYGWEEAERLQALVLLYMSPARPTLLALTGRVEPMQALLAALLPLLPRRFYAHFSPGLEKAIAADFRLTAHGPHYKMGLKQPAHLASINTGRAAPLAKADLPAILELYRLSYPGNWFDPRMLETGQYFGVKDGQALLSIAGIHVYSERYRVAALGNITTHPDYRGQNLARIVTAKLCRSLLERVDRVGLNVKADNEVAIRLYEALGFEIIAAYGEFAVEAIR